MIMVIATILKKIIVLKIILEREDFYITDRKPTIICNRCGKKEVKKSVFVNSGSSANLLI